jgi:hypothetical protein
MPTRDLESLAHDVGLALDIDDRVGVVNIREWLTKNDPGHEPADVLADRYAMWRRFAGRVAEVAPVEPPGPVVLDNAEPVA